MLLVTGASGYVGQHFLARAIAEYSGELLPAWHSRTIKCGVQLNLASAESVSGVFEKNPISAVLHLAAEARTGLCQKDPQIAEAVNINGTANLLEACSRLNPLPYFLHVSSDMVFRGDKAPYSEIDPVDAVSAYGKSKATAEQLVRQYSGPWAIVRPALIYGAPSGGRVSVLSATLQAMRSGEGAFFQDEWRTPVFVDDLVSLILQMYLESATGIVNAGGPDRVSRYEFAEKVASQWAFPLSDVKRGEIGDNPAHAWRPKDISLVSNRAHHMVPFTPINDALARVHIAFPDL